MTSLIAYQTMPLSAFSNEDRQEIQQEINLSLNQDNPSEETGDFFAKPSCNYTICLPANTPPHLTTVTLRFTCDQGCATDYHTNWIAPEWLLNRVKHYNNPTATLHDPAALPLLYSYIAGKHQIGNEQTNLFLSCLRKAGYLPKLANGQWEFQKKEGVELTSFLEKNFIAMAELLLPDENGQRKHRHVSYGAQTYLCVRYPELHISKDINGKEHLYAQHFPAYNVTNGTRITLYWDTELLRNNENPNWKEDLLKNPSLGDWSHPRQFNI